MHALQQRVVMGVRRYQHMVAALQGGEDVLHAGRHFVTGDEFAPVQLAAAVVAGVERGMNDMHGGARKGAPFSR